MLTYLLTYADVYTDILVDYKTDSNYVELFDIRTTNADLNIVSRLFIYGCCKTHFYKNREIPMPRT